MIVPSTLPYVTLYLPEADEYYEFGVSSSQIRFTMDAFYEREAISAKRSSSFKGFRLDMGIQLEQTDNHDLMREFWNNLYEESSNEIQLYLRRESTIEDRTPAFDVIIDSFVAKTNIRNTIARHGYDLSFSGIFPDIGIGLAYVITNTEFLYLTNDNEKYIVQLNPY